MIDHLLLLIDTAYDRASWHGPNLRGALRGVTPRMAAWRPAPGRHNIWEEAVHAAYWKYVAWRRLTGSPKGSFPLEGSNWFSRPQQITQKAWRADLALLQDTHRQLRDVVASLRPSDLKRRPPGSKVTALALITGIGAHDIYHAGQIQLLKRLQG